LFEVYPFTNDSFLESLQNELTPVSSIEKKSHFTYFLSYLNNPEIGARTIVLEKKYISKNFLEDYVSYYAKCFQGYTKYCKRIHLFSEEFNKEDFEKFITKTNSRKLKKIFDSYLGYIVVKPIPRTVIGPTLLKTYEENTSQNRKFFGTRSYAVNLFGHKLSVESLAFQEQDRVTSACATTAIWTALQKASNNNYAKLKTPYEITRSAAVTSKDGNRLFPNKGLTIDQMCKAIVDSGLETELRTVQNRYDAMQIALMKEYVYAYSSVGIPIILGIDIPNAGQHAVAISGMGECNINARAISGVLHLKSSFVNKIYTHDDQHGPFARVVFDELNNKIETPWDTEGSANTDVKFILVPVYPKIRIQYEDVKAIVLAVDRVISVAFELKEDLLWDIKLNYSEDFKERIRASKIKESAKKQVLFNSYPKYVWTAICSIPVSQEDKSITNVNLFEIVFDATDLANAMFAIDLVYHQSWFKGKVGAILKDNPLMKNYFPNYLGDSYEELFT
jgi:hypothetical protein